MHNSKIEEGIAKVKAALKAEGYGDCPFCRNEIGASLYRKDRSNDVYLGTYLNPFSIVKTKGGEGKPLLWADLVGHSAAVLVICPVYRHNGTSADASISVSVHYFDAKPRKWYPADSFYKDEYRDIVKAESPTDYCALGWRWDTCCTVRCSRIAKVRADELTDRRIATIVSKAKKAVEEWECPDYSEFAEDRARWHEDTKAEYFAWKEKQWSA